MHKLLEYVCDEMEDLERKADKGKLSMAELQYADTLAHLKKNILTSDAMLDEDGYSNDYSYARGDGRGRGRNARRDSMGRYSRDDDYSRNYSRDNDDMVSQLRAMERNADDEESRRMIKSWINQIGAR